MNNPIFALEVGTGNQPRRWYIVDTDRPQGYHVLDYKTSRPAVPIYRMCDVNAADNRPAGEFDVKRTGRHAQQLQATDTDTDSRNGGTECRDWVEQATADAANAPPAGWGNV